MSWCPKCKNEYVEGVKLCADCGVELVDSLENTEREPLTFGEQELMERLREFLLYNKIRSAEISFDETEGVYELFVSGQDREKAKMAVSVFLREEKAVEAEDVLPRDKSGIPGYPMPEASGTVYCDSAKRAEENRSSGWMLMIIGGAGLIAALLILTGTIPVPAVGMGRYMMCGVMGALFALFFVMGIVSMRSSRKLAEKAKSESSLTAEIRKWCEENLSVQRIEENRPEEETEGEEMKYFRRTDRMKQLISSQFLHLDEGFLDSFVDDYYPKLFEQEETDK